MSVVAKGGQDDRKRVEGDKAMVTQVAVTAAGLVATAKQRIENLTVEQMAAEIAREDAVIVDIREPQERADSGVIAGAIAAPRGMLEFYADPTSPYHKPEFETDKRVLLYCASGGRSALGAATLQELGYEQVAHLDGGFKAWTAAGMPVAGA
jgi:rhodanese-related sulfurtransferase